MLDLLQEGTVAERHAYYKKLVRTEHIHDYHYPDPTGPPNPSQPCARVVKGTTNMIWKGNQGSLAKCADAVRKDPA